jgi:hypothetical protein
LTEATAVGAMLPQPMPVCPNQRLLLFAVRRMAGGGLTDAHATQALLAAFRGSFRRPLILLRALMAEVSRASCHTLLIAPCCAHRVTEAEAILLDAVRSAERAPHEAYAALSGLLGTDQCLGVLSSAQAVAQAFGDLGRPL